MTLFSSIPKPAAESVRPAAPAAPVPPEDPVAARLQARVQALETQPLRTTSQRHIPTLSQAAVAATKTASAAGPTSSAAVDDLNKQLEVLRDQLEAAFDAVEARVDAAAERAAAAEALAQAADTRAQVASARSANVLHAVDDLAAELTRMVNTDQPGAGRLLNAVERLRARLQAPRTYPTADRDTDLDLDLDIDRTAG